jgi:hypothetical protein
MSELTMRRHQAAAARARRAGDEAAYVRETTAARTEQLAAKILAIADSDPRLSFEQRVRLAATLLGSGDPQ